MTRAEDTVVIRNIYHMMAYAFHSIDIKGYSGLSSEEFDNFADLMAAILTVGMIAQRKRGFERDYTPLHENLKTVRGKIDLRVSTRLALAGRQEISCEYDEFSTNTYKNRILKTCALGLVRSGKIPTKRAQELKKSVIFLQDIDELDPKHIEWSHLRYHRNSGDYPLLMNVCHMVINGLLLSQDEDGKKLANFVDEQALHALYEKFVLEYYRREHPKLKASAKVIDRKVGEDAPVFLPQLCTDITLTNGSKTLIIDAKCYGRILNSYHDKEILSPANLNQIQSYVLHEAYGASNAEVQGVLLYALTDGEDAISETWDEIGHTFHVRTLDLSREFADIAAQLDMTAELIAQQSSPDI